MHKHDDVRQGFEASDQVVEKCNVEMRNVLSRTGISKRRVPSRSNLIKRLDAMILMRKIRLTGQ